MSHITFGYRLPRRVAVPLFGDRERFGLTVVADDPHWIEWEETYLAFYYANQKRSIGKFVNDAGYTVMTRLSLDGLRVLEIGPGDLSHMRFWRGKPRQYIIADVQREMLDRSARELERHYVAHDCILLQRGADALGVFADSEFDAIVSFYSLEHLYPLGPFVEQLVRILKPGGRLIGAIPAEGGLAWGCGRLLTSRRWLKRNTTIDPDKIICWEHPNFADVILSELDCNMHRSYLSYWPMIVPSIDLNLVLRFEYVRR